MPEFKSGDRVRIVECEDDPGFVGRVGTVTAAWYPSGPVCTDPSCCGDPGTTVIVRFSDDDNDCSAFYLELGDEIELVP